jgi:hypothetical protein
MTEKFVINDNAVSYPGGGGKGEKEKKENKSTPVDREKKRANCIILRRPDICIRD